MIKCRSRFSWLSTGATVSDLKNCCLLREDGLTDDGQCTVTNICDVLSVQNLATPIPVDVECSVDVECLCEWSFPEFLKCLAFVLVVGVWLFRSPFMVGRECCVCEGVLVGVGS